MQPEVLYDEPQVVVVGAQNPWTRRRKIKLADLVDEPWTLPPLDTLFGSVVAEAFRASGLNVPRVTVVTSNVSVRNGLLATGRFLTMIQGSVLAFPTNNPALKDLPIELPTMTRRPVGLITVDLFGQAAEYDAIEATCTAHGLWILADAAQSKPAEIRIYNQLFAKPSPDASNFAADLNPRSLEILRDARVEPAIAESNSAEPMQFERQGYFVRDRDSASDRLVFNRTIGLRDTFAKEVAKG